MSPLGICEAPSVSSWLMAAAAPLGIAPLTPQPAFMPTLLLLANKAPALGRPLLDTLSGSGFAAAMAHPLWRKWVQQHAWGEEVHELQAKVFDSTVIERLRSLRALQSSSAGGLWLTQKPGVVEEARFSPSEWQGLLRFRCGVPLYEPNTPCKACGATLDPFGDHPLCCSGNGFYMRHNRVRDALFQSCQ